MQYLYSLQYNTCILLSFLHLSLMTLAHITHYCQLSSRHEKECVQEASKVTAFKALV